VKGIWRVVGEWFYFGWSAVRGFHPRLLMFNPAGLLWTAHYVGPLPTDYIADFTNNTIKEKK